MFEGPVTPEFERRYRQPRLTLAAWAGLAMLIIVTLALVLSAHRAVRVASLTSFRQIEVVSEAPATLFYLHNISRRMSRRPMLLATVYNAAHWRVKWTGPDAVVISVPAAAGPVVLGPARGVNVVVDRGV